MISLVSILPLLLVLLAFPQGAVGKVLPVGEGVSAGIDLPTDGPLTHHVECPAGDADPTHAVVDASRAQTLLGDHETAAFEAEEV